MIRQPKVFKLIVPPGKTQRLGFSQAVLYSQIANTSEGTLTVLLNGDPEAELELQAGEVQSFNPGDMDLWELLFKNPEKKEARVQVLVSLRVE